MRREDFCIDNIPPESTIFYTSGTDYIEFNLFEAYLETNVIFVEDTSTIYDRFKELFNVKIVYLILEDTIWTLWQG